MQYEKKCAFLTCEDRSPFYIYDYLVIPELNRLGWNVEEIPWNLDTDWDLFDVVVIRSTWDYQSRVQDFLRVLEQIDRSKAILHNSLNIVEWNIDKSYLRKIEDKGCLIVPTSWQDHLTLEELRSMQERFDCEWIITKPLIGANADHIFKVNPSIESSELDAALLHYSSQPVMIQPFIQSVVDHGEYSLFYFGGQYSHSILKTPKKDDFRVQEEHGGSLQLVQPESSLLKAGNDAMEKIGESLLYARVDLVILPDGRPALMELELIEPSLYFNLDPDSPERFAEALDRNLG